MHCGTFLGVVCLRHQPTIGKPSCAVRCAPASTPTPRRTRARLGTPQEPTARATRRPNNMVAKERLVPASQPPQEQKIRSRQTGPKISVRRMAANGTGTAAAWRGDISRPISSHPRATPSCRQPPSTRPSTTSSSHSHGTAPPALLRTPATSRPSSSRPLRTPGRAPPSQLRTTAPRLPPPTPRSSASSSHRSSKWPISS